MAMVNEPQARSGSPRPWLLLVLGLLVVIFLITRGWTHFSAATPPGPSNPPRGARGGQKEAIDPEQLTVRLNALEVARPEQGRVERNPFRFQPRPAPAPPPEVLRPAPPVNTGPPPPPPIPPIPLKLMGFVEVKDGGRLAALSDCKGGTWSAREGQVVDGQYRVISVGRESVVIEYVNGKGRQTLRVDGCPPR
jgi:hypothetical protein